MITLVTMYEEDPATGKKMLLVSHGIDERTGRNVCLPGEHPKDLGGVYDDDLMEWVLREEPVRPPLDTLKPERKPARVDWFSQDYDTPKPGM
jgi:hypothetical protein